MATSHDKSDSASTSLNKNLTSQKLRYSFINRKFWNRYKFLRNVLVLGGGTALGQGLFVLSSPVISRLYTPEDLGLLTLFMSFIGTAWIASSLCFERAIVAARETEEAVSLVVGAIYISLFTSILSSLGLYGLIRFNLLGLGHLPSWSAIFAIPTLLLASWTAIFRYWFIREGWFKEISHVTVLQNALRAIVPIGLCVLSWGWFGLLAGEMVGRGFGVKQLWQRTWPHINRHVHRNQIAAVIQVLKRHREFPLINLPSSLLNTLSITLILPIITQLYGVPAAGQFALVQRVLGVPVSLIGNSVADVFQNRVAAYTRQADSESSGALRKLFLKVAIGLFGVGLVPVLLLAWCGPLLFQKVFGAQWLPAGTLASAMAPWLLAQLVVSPLSRIVLVIGGHRNKLVYDFISILALGVLYFSHKSNYSLVTSVALFSWVQVTTYVVYFFILLHLVSQFPGPKGSLRDY